MLQPPLWAKHASELGAWGARSEALEWGREERRVQVAPNGASEAAGAV